jgi:O-antigen/teichoic acid export membrane protein
MVVFHIAGVALICLDRYIVLGFWDKHAVGQYAAGYNLAAMVQQVLALPVGLAVVPLYMNLWSRGDHEGARTFVQSTLRWFWLGVWPCVFGVVAVKSDLILLLASEKYVESSSVIGYVLLGYILYGGYPIYAAGLLSHKKTMTMCFWMVVAVAINVLANLILIPRFYILGAAAATTLSYGVLTVALARASKRHLTVRFWPREATVYLAGAFVMFEVVRSFSLATPWLSLGVRVVVGSLIYGLWVMAADEELRRRVMRMAQEQIQRLTRNGRKDLNSR